MYSRLLIPLDGSKTAESVLPYSRFLSRSLKLPVELLEVVDPVEAAQRILPEKAHALDSVLESVVRSREQYLKAIAATFRDVQVGCAVEKGVPEAVIIERAAADKGTLINMATHGRSGIDRWLLGSVAEKVLRGSANPLLLIRAQGTGSSDGETVLRSIVTPLDGSELAESVLPQVATLAKQLNAEVVLFRAYTMPFTAYPIPETMAFIDYQKLLGAIRAEAVDYLEAKAEALRGAGVERVSCVAVEGPAADEIISLARKTPDNLIAMCTHGRSGVRRWVLGSVTETVVRHSGDPVLVIRAPESV